MPSSLIDALASLRGRLPRLRFCYLFLALIAAFVLSFVGLENLLGRASTWVLYPPAFWIALSLTTRRYHDLNKRAWWLLVLLIPLLGPIWVGFELFLRRGTTGDNRFGRDRLSAVHDYHVVK
ncbi:DUF805 domain-containing protein [Arenimonas oryziterrae]|uniref:DUF805 domain-containing protein n=1 Tax=Arenimonas oryziterrae TaxID=498055 RepID=UPI000407B5B1|nr:DUF805 domain-containing protein [Arenimonas oryziterrae]